MATFKYDFPVVKFNFQNSGILIIYETIFRVYHHIIEG